MDDMTNETFTDPYYTQTPIARQCQALDGLRALVRFAELHPEVLGDFPTIRIGVHCDDPAVFLNLESVLGGERVTGGHYVASERKFSDRVSLSVQTYRSKIEATPERIAEFIEDDDLIGFDDDDYFQFDTWAEHRGER